MIGTKGWNTAYIWNHFNLEKCSLHSFFFFYEAWSASVMIITHIELNVGSLRIQPKVTDPSGSGISTLLTFLLNRDIGVSFVLENLWWWWIIHFIKICFRVSRDGQRTLCASIPCWTDPHTAGPGAARIYSTFLSKVLFSLKLLKLNLSNIHQIVWWSNVYSQTDLFAHVQLKVQYKILQRKRISIKLQKPQINVFIILLTFNKSQT